MEGAALHTIMDAWTGVEPGIRRDDELVFKVADGMFCAFERPPLANARPVG